VPGLKTEVAGFVYDQTVKDIVAAVELLKPAEFTLLRRELDRIEARMWEAELDRASQLMKKRRMTDRDIDRMVLRRRRESRR
jgi:hypothetical protein